MTQIIFEITNELSRLCLCSPSRHIRLILFWFVVSQIAIRLSQDNDDIMASSFIGVVRNRPLVKQLKMQILRMLPVTSINPTKTVNYKPWFRDTSKEKTKHCKPHQAVCIKYFAFLRRQNLPEADTN